LDWEPQKKKGNRATEVVLQTLPTSDTKPQYQVSRDLGTMKGEYLTELQPESHPFSSLPPDV